MAKHYGSAELGERLDLGVGQRSPVGSISRGASVPVDREVLTNKSSRMKHVFFINYDPNSC